MNASITQHGRIVGTRSSIYDVYYYLEKGYTVLQIADILRISAEQAQAASDHIAAHRAEVAAVHREIEERNARGNSPEIRAELQDARARLEAWLVQRRQAQTQEANGAGTARRRQP